MDLLVTYINYFRMKNKILQSLLSNFFKGLFLLVPFFLTIFIIWQTFNYIDNLTVGILKQLNIPYFKGLGMILTILFILMVGFIGGSLIFKPIVAWMDKQLGNLPLVKLIYTSLKDFMSAFVGKKKKFSEAVLVRSSPDTEFYKLGFITQNDLNFLGLPDYMVAVYFPHSYAFSGNLWIVPSHLVSKVDMPASQAMKFIVSGGVSGGESEEDLGKTN